MVDQFPLLDKHCAAETPRSSREWRVLGMVFSVAAVLLLVASCGISYHNAEVHVPSATELSSSKKAYTRAQYLGFNLFTTPGTSADGCLDSNGPDQNCYLGSEDFLEDVKARAAILRHTLERVYATDKWDRDASTLKVFTVPEFYWRGPHGAYRFDPSIANITQTLLHPLLGDFASEARWKDWLFVWGTNIFAERLAPDMVDPDRPHDNISYYNFAFLHLGGTEDRWVKFKQYVSSIDFLQTSPSSQRDVPPAPGTRSEFCKKFPAANGCTYNKASEEWLARFGFYPVKVMHTSILEIGGLKIGIEICLDHKMGTLARDLGPDETVDLHLIVSAGMAIASGPVCTRQGGPVFLNDGFAQTKLNLNEFGGGRNHVITPNGQKDYNVGIVYMADTLVAVQQWLGDSIATVTGTGFGTRRAGSAALPGGSERSGKTGISFTQINALGPNWTEALGGVYNTASYVKIGEVFSAMKKMRKPWFDDVGLLKDVEGIQDAQIGPTVDIYGPLDLF